MFKKSLLLMLLMAFMAPWAAMGQTLPVYENGDYTNSYVPIYGYYADEAQQNQMIYPANELTAMNGKDITKMVFYYSSTEGNKGVGSWTVSVGETEASALEGLNTTTTLTEVFSGGLDALFNTTDKTLTITFTTPYAYHGGNLLVEFNHPNPVSGQYQKYSFKGQGGFENDVSYNSQQSAHYTFLPRITFSYETHSACAKPSNLTSTTTGVDDPVHNISLSWNAGSTETSWDIKYNANADFNPENEGTLVENVTNPYLLEGLTGGVTYYAYVRGHCPDGTNVSNWSSEVCSFTTENGCDTPTNITASAIPGGATISWEDENTPIKWQIAYNTTCNYSYPTIPPTESTIVDVTTNPTHTLDGLEYGLNYYYWVRSVCGNNDGTSSWSSYHSFTTLVQYPVPTITSCIPTPDGAVVTWSKGYNETEWKLQWRQYVNGSYTVWHEIGDLTSQSYTVTGMASSCQYSYIQIKAVYGEYESEWSESTNFTTLDACPVPTSLNASDITTTSASINWTPGYDEEAWKVQYYNGTNWEYANNGNAITARPYTLTGLSSSSPYQVKVQAFCDPEGSEWSDPVSFTTACGLVDLTQSKTYDFEDYDYGQYEPLPACWNGVKNGNYPYINSYSYYANSGSKYVVFSKYNTNDEILVLPEINIATYPMDNTQVRFMARTSSGNGNLSIGMVSNIDDIANSFVMIQEVTIEGSTYNEYKVKFNQHDFTQYTDEQLASMSYIAIKLDTQSLSIYVDDVTVEVIPACSEPTAFACTGVTENTATFSWMKGNHETAWQIAYSTTEGFDPDEATDVTIVNTVNANDYQSFTISGLTAEQTYYAHVRSACATSSTGYTDWNDDEVMFKPSVEQTFTAYDETDLTPNSNVPIQCYYADYALRSQFIIPASEIPTAVSGKNITKMKFYLADEFSLTTNSFEVLIKGIDETSTLTAFINTDDAAVVYNGSISISSKEMEIIFSDEGYPYDGGNLLIAFQKEKGGDCTYSEKSFYGKSVSNAAWQGHGTYSSSTMASITGSSNSFAPKTTFTYVPRVVTGVAFEDATDITINSATAHWTGGVQPFTLKYKKNSDGIEGWSEEYQVNSREYALEGLDPGTAYDVKVKSTGDADYTTRENYFTTKECTTPTELTVATTYCSATLTWTAGNALAWDVQYREADGGEWTLVENITEATYTINGLEELTDYTAKVRATCNTTWMSFEPFTTGTVTAIEVTPEEAFTEDLKVSEIPAGWTSVDNKWTANYGSYVMSTGSSALLLTPMLKITGVARISVEQRVTGNGTNCTILATYDGGNTFMEGSINAAPTTGSASINYFDIPAEWIGKKLQIAFKYEGSSSYRWQLYQVNIFMATKFTTEGNWNEASKWNFGVPTANIDAIINAAATIPYGTVAQAKNITIGTGSLTLADGGQLICNNAPVVKAQKTITAWTTGEAAGGWYFIASPVAADLDPDDVTGMLTDANELEGERTYDLYWLENTMWRNYRSTNFNLTNGQGYLYANQSAKTLEFEGAIRVYDAGNNTVPVTAGWNLIGNPYTFNAYITGSYYVIGSSSSESNLRDIIVAGTNGAAIAPCNGVIVKATGNGSVAFSKTAPTQNVNNGNLQMTLSQQVTNTRGISNKTLDNAIVSFNEGSQLEKFYFMQQNANLYIPQGAEEYAIATSNGQGTMPVNFRANKNGQYTLTVNAENVEMNYLHLIDNMTGADVDLLATPSYTFNATTTDYESRFKLVFVSATDNAEGSNDSFAFISNGQLIIANEGQATLQVVDVMGRILSSETINGSVSKSLNAPAGIYMLRLVNGDNVKVQKMVVR